MTHKKYLATTAISDIWNLESDLLLLGPWCLTEENKKLLETKNYTMVESPWRPFGPKIKEAADYCHRIYEESLPEIGRALNELHSVSYPERYWRVLLGPWLLHFIGVLYERYVRIEHALKVYPDLYTCCLDGNCEVSSNDTQDFFHKVNSDEYNFKLFSLICTYLGVAGNKISSLPSRGIPYSSPNPLSIRGLLRGAKRLVEKSIATLVNGPVVLADMYHLQQVDYVSLSLKTGYRLFHNGKFHYNGAHFKYSPDVRTRLTSIYQGNDSFIRFLHQVLPLAIPRCYIEGFNFYRKGIPSVSGVKVIGSAVGWYLNERFKFFIATATTNGVHLIDFQHGGNYGIALIIPPEDLSLEKDVFYVWGWDDPRAGYNSKLVKLPSPHLSRLKDSYSYSTNKILYIGTGVPRYHYRFYSYFLPEEFISYIADTKRFLLSLPEGLKSHILYRPFPHYYGWNIEEIVKDTCPQAELLINLGAFGRLTDWMKRVRICVIDHLANSYIEALAINVPCIFFWNHEVFVMRPEAEEYFELLREAGILHKDPKAAAAKLSEVFDDPWTWWKSKEIQDARVNFLERFGYSRKNWIDYWAKEIRSLASEGTFAHRREAACPQKR